MDLTDPTRAITPTLDGPILAALASAGRPLTVGEIATQAPRGSEIGVRKAVGRLVDQGIVTATQMGRNVVHELNRDHVAAPAAAALAGLRNELWTRLRETLDGWALKPMYASVFGSAARRDGGPESDIDLLLVHPNLPGDKRPPKRDKGFWGQLNDVAAGWASQVPLASNGADWLTQVDQLRAKVQRWTGNPLQVVDVSLWQWAGMRNTDPALFDQIARDGVTVAGQAFVTTLAGIRGKAMTASRDRTTPGGMTEARARLRSAEAYLQTAERVLEEASAQEFTNVAAGNAVLAGIAASDSISYSRLRKLHRGQDHRGAAHLLGQATPDGKALGSVLSRLLDVKDASHYGTTLVTRPRAADSVKWARKLVERAREELER